MKYQQNTRDKKNGQVDMVVIKSSVMSIQKIIPCRLFYNPVHR